jgi:hypothetical protein
MNKRGDDLRGGVLSGLTPIERVAIAAGLLSRACVDIKRFPTDEHCQSHLKACLVEFDTARAALKESEGA